MRHFLTTADWTRDELQRLLDEAQGFKREPIQPRLKDRAIALVFFNPSLRTRASFEIGAAQLGAKAVVLEPGRGSWPIEFHDGAVMDGEPEEHVAEVARVLSRYCDLIAVRAFPRFVNWTEDREDLVIRQFAHYATVRVINMETITHPCQELALMLALQEHGLPARAREPGNSHGLPAHAPGSGKFLLTWTYHPKPLNTAVANSAVLIASKFGFDVTLLCPTPEYALDERYMELGRQYCAENGRRFEMVHDIEAAYRGANVVYAKSWGALPYFGRWEEEKPIRERYKHFIVDDAKMALTPDAVFSHCLPIRRNVKATDAVLDSPRCLAIEEAENRLHVQKAIMDRLINVHAVSPPVTDRGLTGRSTPHA